MEIVKNIDKSNGNKPRLRLTLNKLLNDKLYIKRSLILKKALNKNKIIKTNLKIQRLKTNRDLSEIKKEENTNEASIDYSNNIHKKEIRRNNLLIELENILESNTKKTEKFVESFRDLKEENKKFYTNYEELKTPVEERIKKNIFESIKLFRNKRLMELDNSINIFPYLIEKNGNELLAQNKAALTLFKQCPLTIKNGRDIYFYYISNHFGEIININDHKYIKYMKQIEDYLDNKKIGKSNSTNKELGKEESQLYLSKEKKKLTKIKEKKSKRESKNILNERVIGLPLKKIKSTQVILNSNLDSIKRKSKICKRNTTFIEYNSDKKLIINSKEIQKLLSKSKDSIIKNENKENSKSKKKSNLIKRKNKDLSLSQFTPIKNSNHNIILKDIYSNTSAHGNKKSEKINKFNMDKVNEKKIRSKSTKKLSFKFERNSIKDIDNSFHIKTSDTFNESNSITKTQTRKNMSSSKLDFIYDDEFIKRNRKKNKTMRLFKYIKNIKINENNKEYMKFYKNKMSNLSEDLKKDMIKVKEENGDISNEHKRSLSILNLYEKARNYKSFDKDNNEEINEYLKYKGLKKEDVLKAIRFNSEKTFVNLRNKTNKLNIEAKTKAFFYGIIPNKRKRKIEQLNLLNSKINQMEREYIKTLIDKDLHF